MAIALAADAVPGDRLVFFLLISGGTFCLFFLNSLYFACVNFLEIVWLDQVIEELFEAQETIEDLQVLVDAALNCAAFIRYGSEFGLSVILLLFQSL